MTTPAEAVKVSQHQNGSPVIRDTFHDYAKGLPWSVPVTTTATTSTPSKKSSFAKHITSRKGHGLGSKGKHRDASRLSQDNPTYPSDPANLNSTVSSRSNAHDARPLHSAPQSTRAGAGTYDDISSGVEESANTTGGVKLNQVQNTDPTTDYGHHNPSHPMQSVKGSGATSSSRYSDGTVRPNDYTPINKRQSREIPRKPVNDSYNSRSPPHNRSSRREDTLLDKRQHVSLVDQRHSQSSGHDASRRQPEYDNYNGRDSTYNDLGSAIPPQISSSYNDNSTWRSGQGSYGEHGSTQLSRTAQPDIPVRSGKRDVVAYSHDSKAIYHGPRDGYTDSAADGYRVSSYTTMDEPLIDDSNGRSEGQNVTQSTTITTPAGYTTTTTSTPHTSRPLAEERSAAASAMQPRSIIAYQH